MDDYFRRSEAERDLEENRTAPLCCCEYFDLRNRRYHILGCCCDCEDCDRVFTDWLTCRRTNTTQRRHMLLTFQDRLRIPWRGGAKQVTLEAVLPIFVIPLLISLAAINAYTCTVIFLATISGIGYAYYCAQRNQARTRFFCMWLFWSLLYMAVLFETTVSLLEMLPEENLLLVFLSVTSIICLHRTRLRASMNFVVQSAMSADELPDIAEASAVEEEEDEEEAAQTTLLLENDSETELSEAAGHQPNICPSCRKCVPARTAHCTICGACILRRDHHSYWLNCCVGKWNHGFYVAGLFFAVLALLLGTDLTLTAVCHPFQLFDSPFVTIMLPDDCSEVFDIYELGIAFVIAVYALMIAVYAFAMLIRQVYLISRGITLHECQRGHTRGNKRHVKQNWQSFVS